MNQVRRIVAGVGIAVGLLAVSACGQAPWEDSMRDLENAQVRDPGSVVLWNNVDLHPNLARVCADGLAFVTTTREYGDAWSRVPEWDDACKGAEDTIMK